MRRPLAGHELAEMRLIFGDGLDYSRIRLVEDAAWTNRLARVWRRLIGAPPPTADYACTLGSTVYVPRLLRTSPEAIARLGVGDLGWLAHELTHVWQFQHEPARTITRGFWTQLRQGVEAYRYGGQARLAQARAAGKSMADFYPEQQGEIVRDYYLRHRRGEDTAAWEPLIRYLQRRV
jgi:hypothetical protein